MPSRSIDSAWYLHIFPLLCNHRIKTLTTIKLKLPPLSCISCIDVHLKFCSFHSPFKKLIIVKTTCPKLCLSVSDTYHSFRISTTIFSIFDLFCSRLTSGKMTSLRYSCSSTGVDRILSSLWIISSVWNTKKDRRHGVKA